jgi:Ca2+-binding RTX toxin-like protein
MPDEVFDFTDNFPEPWLSSEGIATNESGSDYSFERGVGSVLNSRPDLLSGGLRIFNDSKLDGDTILFLEQRPKANGTFGSGFTQDLYVFDENIDRSGGTPKEVTEKDQSASPSTANSLEFTYVAQIPTNKASQKRFAVVLIQDNERDPGTLRRTALGSGNDVIEFLFDDKDDTILAGAGNDIIRSGGGNDIVFGEDGDDQIFGGEGTNYLFGNKGNDSLFGGSGKDFLDGGLGNDRLEGGNGNDIYVVDSLGDIIIDQPGSGIETIRASVDWTLQAGLDHLFLSGAAIKGQGNSLNNFIRGNNFDNILEGGDGDDILFGDEIVRPNNDELDLAKGNLHFVVSYEDFFPYINANGIKEAYYNRLYQTNDPNFAGADTLRGGNGDDTLFGWGGNDSLYGDAGNDLIFGGLGDDKLYGGEGTDRLDGGLGADQLEGGTGDDIYVIDNINDIIIDRSGTGIETVESSITFDLIKYSVNGPIVGATGLDNLTLTGMTAIDAFGNNLPNILLGNEGDNTLNGREGNDTLIVTRGKDILFGGLGADTFRFKEVPLYFASSPVPFTGETVIKDFKPGEDVIEISSSAFSNPSLGQFGFNGTDLLFNGKSLATIQTSSPFSVNQSVRLV